MWLCTSIKLGQKYRQRKGESERITQRERERKRGGEGQSKKRKGKEIVINKMLWWMEKVKEIKRIQLTQRKSNGQGKRNRGKNLSKMARECEKKKNPLIICSLAYVSGLMPSSR